MNKKGFLRRTRQREVILSVLRSTTSHPTADWVYQEVRKEMPNVSLGTIYRNLKILTEMGEALELSYGSTYSRFDGNTEEHYHFVCESCDNVFDIDMPLIEGIGDNVEEAMGAKVTSHRLEFYGKCKDCLAKRDSVAN